MPEEINRRVTDLLSDLLFVTSPEAIDNLVAMGIARSTIHFVGNPMIDTLRANLDRLDQHRCLRNWGFRPLWGRHDAQAGQR